MSDYIRRDKALAELHLDYKDVIYIDKQAAAERIRKIPYLDIVRCVDCIFCKVHNTKDLYARCTKFDINFFPFQEDTRTNYCSWGERREPWD